MNEIDSDIPIRGECDLAILMHRDVHFGGKFAFMLDYYRKSGRGAQQEFEVEQIEKIAIYQESLGSDLAPILLSGADAEKVAKAKKCYQQLREIYQVAESPKNNFPRLIADLILSEEEEPAEAIEAIVAHKNAIVPELLQLLKAEEFYDPLFPGYGQAPLLAAKCLGRIGDKRAIIALFQAIGEGDFNDDETLFEAMRAIGAPAKEFLMKVVQGMPLNNDNAKAASALLIFKDEEHVAPLCLQLLMREEMRRDPLFASYLSYVCEGLKSASERNSFIALADDPKTPKSLKREIETIAKSW